MYIKKYIIILVFCIFSCRSSPLKSFNNLSDAFLNWYFRYNPIKSSQYNIGDNHYQYTSYESTRRDEYYADISRFLIELSQIDETKIPFDSRIDYKILYSNYDDIKKTKLFFI